MTAEGNPFELVDDEGDGDTKKPAPKQPAKQDDDDHLPPLELEPELEEVPIVADPGPSPVESVPAGGEDPMSAAAVEEIALEEAEPDAPATPPAEEPSDGATVRMSLADVVNVWDEEAPDAAAGAAAAATEPPKDRSAIKRVTVMVLVIAAVLGAIVVLFGS